MVLERDRYESAYAAFLTSILDAVQRTFAEEQKRGLTLVKLSENLGLSEQLVRRRLKGQGIMTLRTICDLYIAMGRQPFDNFKP